MKTKLIVITDNFPFNGGEQFFEAEYQRLVAEFEVVIVSSSTSDNQTRRIHPDSRVIKYNPQETNIGLVEKVAILFDFVSHKANFSELFSILRSNDQILRRLKYSLRYFGLSRRMFFQLKSELDRNPDHKTILYFYWFNYKPIYFALKLAKHPQYRLISRVHRYDLFNETHPVLRQPYRQIMDTLLHKVLFVAKFGMDYYLETFNIRKSDKHEIMYLGTPKPKQLPQSTPNREFVICSCSNVVPIKRVELIVEALAQLEMPNRRIKWVHFGHGRLFESVADQAARKLKPKPGFDYLLRGEVSNTEILRFYQDNVVDCFITLSSSEGLPVSIMEAMSYGIPIVSTDVGGIKEMLPDEYPFLVDSEVDIQRVAQCIRAISELSERDLIIFRQQIISQWETHFNEAVNTSKLITFLKNL